MKKTLSVTALTALICTLSGCSAQLYPADSSPGTTVSTDGSADTTAAASDTTAAAEGTVLTEAAAAESVTAAATAETAAATAAATTAAPETAASQTEPPAATTAEAAAATAENGWKAAYQETLRAFQNSGEIAADAKWDLQDLDQDGIPELLISEGPYHAGGVRFFYYENGSASPVLKADGKPAVHGSYGAILFCREEHLIGIQDVHMGYSYAFISKYENHRFTTLHTFNEDSGAVGDENATYTVDNETVTAAAYQQSFQVFTTKNWKEAGAAYSLDDFSPLS